MGWIQLEGSSQGSFGPSGLARLFASCAIFEIKTRIQYFRLSLRQTLDLSERGGGFRHFALCLFRQPAHQKKLKRVGVEIGSLGQGMIGPSDLILLQLEKGEAKKITQGGLRGSMECEDTINFTSSREVEFLIQICHHGVEVRAIGLFDLGAA